MITTQNTVKTSKTPEGDYITTDGRATVYHRPHGWDLVVDGEWWNTFATKKAALSAYAATI